VAALALAALLVVPTGCASRSGWHSPGWGAAMMGGMIVGGLVLGRGFMHGGWANEGWGAADVERFQPALLLLQRDSLALADTQVAALEAIEQDRAAGRRGLDDAARAAFAVLTPDQRRLIRGAAVPRGHH
jgi:hypothetical protein